MYISICRIVCVFIVFGWKKSSLKPWHSTPGPPASAASSDALPPGDAGKNQRRIVGKSGNPGWICFGRAGKSGKVWKVSDFFDFPKFQNPAIAEFHSPGLQLLGLHQLLQLRPSLFFISSKNSNAMWGMTLSWLVVSRVGAEKLVSVICPILMIWVPFSLFLEMIQ